MYTTERKSRCPSSFRKLRRLVSNNKTGDVMGITISRPAAEMFSGTYFREEIGEGMIVLISGCPHGKENTVA